MGPPWMRIAAVAFIGAVLLRLWAPEGATSRTQFALVAAALWLAQLVAWTVWSTFIWPLFVSPLRRLPQPGGSHWLFGHGLHIFTSSPSAPLSKWAKEVPNDGILRYLFFLNRERLLITSPKALAEVLVTKTYLFNKPETLQGTVGHIVGNGILLAEGDEHKVQRRNLLPAFNYRHVKNLYPTFWAKATSATRAMTTACPDGHGVLEVHSWATRCTLDIIGAAGLGVEFSSIHDQQNELVQAYRRVTKQTPQSRVIMTMGMLLPPWFVSNLPVRRNRIMRESTETIRAVCRQSIRDKKQRLAAKEALAETDMLTVALGSGLFDGEALVDQLMTFLAAGHDTTAAALTWALYQLSRFPDKQQRLRDEMRAGLPAPAATDDEEQAAGGVSGAAVDALPYLNAVCSEVLRTNAPVPMTIREAAVDTTIQGWPVPRGTRVMLSPAVTNMNPELWGPDAAEFKPERWLPSSSSSSSSSPTASPTSSGSGGATNNYAFMTFLHGPRSCIGAGFARAELACLLAAWVGRFEFSLDDPALVDQSRLKLDVAVTSRPAGGMMLRTRVVPGW